MKFVGNWMRVALMAVAALAVVSCSNEFARNSSPVALIVTDEFGEHRDEHRAGDRRPTGFPGPLRRALKRH